MFCPTTYATEWVAEEPFGDGSFTVVLTGDVPHVNLSVVSANAERLKDLFVLFKFFQDVLGDRGHDRFSSFVQGRNGKVRCQDARGDDAILLDPVSEELWWHNCKCAS